MAVHVASLVPQRVRGLVLVDGGPGMDPATTRYMRQQFLTQPWFYDSVDSFAAELQRRHSLSDPQLLQDMARHALRPLATGRYELKCDRQLLSALGAANDELLLWSKLESFDGPALVVRGAGSAMLGRKTAERMVKNRPRRRLHTVPGAGHTVMLDNPDDFLFAIKTFLAEVGSNPVPRAGIQRDIERSSI